MNYTLQEKDGQPYIECQPDGGRIENEQDAVDLVGICGEEGTQRLMLHAENLTDAFFDLKTGVAEAIIETLKPIQTEYARLLADKAYLNEMMKLGAERAQTTARKTVRKVYHKMGFDA